MNRKSRNLKMVGWLKLSWIVLIFVLHHKILVTGEVKRNWTYELLSVEVENKSPDKTIMDLYLTRISRGVKGISGLVDIKEDWTNDLSLSIIVYYSMTGSNFIKTPIQVPPMKLDTFMNVHYKNLLQETLMNCSDNAPRVEGKFVSPLKKRTYRLHNCIFLSDYMPERLQSGFYKTVISFTKQFMLDIIAIDRVEPTD